MRCDLIMAVWNEPDITLAALKSLHEHSHFPYRAILIDNASDEPTASMLRRLAHSGEYGQIELLRNEQNQGWLKATNQGLSVADAEYVCLINNDVIAGPNWLLNCIATLERITDAGLANPRGNERSENRQVNSVTSYAQDLSARYSGRFTEMDHACGFCMVIKREVLNQIPVLDEAFEGGHFEDNDYSRKAQQLGYRCIQCDDAFVFHRGSVSFKKKPGEKERLHARNKAIYEQRWGKPNRLLVLCQTPDNGDLLRRARQGEQIYVISNRFFNATNLPIPHNNITLLNSPLACLSERLYFRLERARLRHRGRIDRAIVVE